MKKIAGIVEGFFSRPLPIWSNNERRTIITLLSKSDKITYYFYCPKQDPYILKYWDRIYTVKNIEQIQQVIALCNKKNIAFCYGFNPIFQLFDDEKSYSSYLRKIYRKINQLVSCGCRNIALLYDDILLLYLLEDGEKIRDEQKIADLLVKIANTVYTKYADQIDTFIFCFYDYYFKKKSILTETIKRCLNPKIFIVWTGGNRFVKQVTYKNLLRTKLLLGKNKRIILWSNYPSNNCEHNLGVFHLDPFNNPEYKVYRQIDGILVNPMREAFANITVLKSFLAYLEKPDKYGKNTYNTIFQQLFGNNWRLFYELMMEFSYPNITARNKFLVRFLKMNNNVEKVIGQYSTFIKLLQRELQIIDSGNSTLPKEAQLFVMAIKNLINETRAFVQICEKILSGVDIPYNLYETADNFPDYPKRANYLLEINAIVNKRIKLIEVVLNKVIIQQNELFKKIAYYLMKYEGSKKTAISRTDLYEIIALINSLIEWERKVFYENILESPAISARTKIYLFARRKNINRYAIS